MDAAVASAALHRLAWRANDDSFDVALAVNRLLAGGARVWWAGGESNEGDYVVEASRRQIDALAALGIQAEPYQQSRPGDHSELKAPVTVLFAGTASSYPYYAYYALCLLRLGMSFRIVDGKALAAGALDDANLLVLPGGFATWGIDNAEDAPGADHLVRGFLQNGGAAIGSCGGAYYLSSGRPAWTGTAAAKPRYTHEYLQSGVGVVDLTLAPGPLSRGCPPTMEVPYYHGPIYDELGPGLDVVARFHNLVLPGHVGIDNPLDHERFARDMAGRPAILAASGPRGRAVLFSPHPEMGDLLRKYIALDGYVRRYLPIRGFGTLHDTMRHYRVADSPSFRLVLNAVHELMAQTETRAVMPKPLTVPNPPALAGALRQGLASVPSEEGEVARLIAEVSRAIADRIAPAGAKVTAMLSQLRRDEAEGSRLGAMWHDLAATALAHASVKRERPAAMRLLEAELGVALMETWARLAEVELALNA